jgi:hypothetical protein
VNVPATHDMLMKADGSAGRERKKRRLAPQRGADAMMREDTGDGDDDGGARDDGALAHTRD